MAHSVRRWRLIEGGFPFLVMGALLAPGAASALECDVGICAGNPCTITGSHRLEPDCVLDFSGKDVTLAPNGSLIAPTPETTTQIRARNLLVRGVIMAVGATLELDIEEDLTLARSPGRGLLKIRRKHAPDGFFLSSLFVEAGGDVILGGRTIYVGGDQASVDVRGASVQVNSRIVCEAFQDVAIVGLATTSGPATTSEQIIARGRPPFGAGGFEMFVAGDVTIGAPVDVIRPTGVFLDAGGSVNVLADMRIDAVDNSSSFDVEAGGDITIAGDVDVRGFGTFGDGGFVSLRPGPAGALTVSGTIDASSLSTSGFASGGTINAGPACSIELPGALVALGAPGGATRLTYRETLDLTGGTLLAGATGGNRITCRCANPPACDAGCAQDPVGLGAATIDPAATIVPADLAACP